MAAPITASPKATARARRRPGNVAIDAPVLPVVGIGASAGGLEALEEFFRHVPPDAGVAYVVVQHLDPTQRTLLGQLLGRVTALPVAEARHQAELRPNSVYVIPPNKNLTLANGRLLLSDPLAPRGLRLPIDSFFRSLAAERGHRCAGVVLSGMGADGTLGLRAIREAGGVTLVQDPTSARFDSMPASALSDAPVDIVATPQVLAEKLFAVLAHKRALRPEPSADERNSHSSLEAVIGLLRLHCGHDFSSYKKSTAYRRIERRMAIHQLPKIADYVVYLQENRQELQLLFKELLIGVTSFFRDPVAWEVFEQQALPVLLAERTSTRTLRAWVPACSTGEEAYSLAIAFKETAERVAPKTRFALQIFATDLHGDAIARARSGLFAATIAADLTPARLQRYFVETENGYRIAKEIRQMVTFAPQNVILDPPFTKLDILCCRNLLIYFEQDLQKRLIPLFHYSLTPGGLLFLGSAETIGTFTSMFEGIDRKARIFRRLDGLSPPASVEFPTRSFASLRDTPEDDSGTPTRANLQGLADQLLLQSFAPAAVLVGHQGDILYISGRTGKYLEPAAGKANWNVHAMARPGLRLELAAALHKAVRDKTEVVIERVSIEGDHGPYAVRVVVHYVEQPDALRGMLMIVFRDLADTLRTRTRGAHGPRIAELEGALQQAHEENQLGREEMQTAHEELKSSNEELQSTNEELQSTNEELTTSKEELQSMNEELQMVNHELNAKLDELSWASNDMANLLNSTGLAAIFLTGAFNVRRFTTHATRIFKLIPSDVGRPLSDIVTDLDYPGLIADAQEVLRTLVFKEREASARDGRSYWVRIMPYRIADHTIDGVVITFAEAPAKRRRGKRESDKS